MSSCMKTPTIQGTLPGLGDEIPGADNTGPPKQGAEEVVLMRSCFSRLCCFILGQVLWEGAGRGAKGHHTLRVKWAGRDNVLLKKLSQNPSSVKAFLKKSDLFNSTSKQPNYLG